MNGCGSLGCFGTTVSRSTASELQLDALHIATQDFSAYATARRKYIVLITDGPFHENEGGSSVTKQQVFSEITASGCPVFVSLWDTDAYKRLYSEHYVDFTSNGCLFDAVDYDGIDTSGNWKYPLVALRTRILAE